MSAGGEFHRVVWRAWSAWEALRRCGFSADDIYVGTGIDGRDDGVFVQLQTQGKKFSITVGRLGAGLDEDAFIAEWRRFCERLNEGKVASPGEMFDIYMSEMNAWGGAVRLVLAIKAKGIEIHWPKLEDDGMPSINAFVAGGVH